MKNDNLFRNFRIMGRTNIYMTESIRIYQKNRF